jgi:hypothetical protein
MALVRKVVVLGLAALGLYKAWEIASVKLAEMRERAADAKARIEPALRETEDTVHAAAEDVSASIHDLSQTVADAVSTAVSNPPAHSPDQGEMGRLVGDESLERVTEF